MSHPPIEESKAYQQIFAIGEKKGKLEGELELLKRLVSQKLLASESFSLLPKTLRLQASLKLLIRDIDKILAIFVKIMGE